MAQPSTDTTTIKCGFCLSKNEDLVDPKQLPCSHIHCMGCLTGFYEEHDIIQCPVAECGYASVSETILVTKISFIRSAVLFLYAI